MVWVAFPAKSRAMHATSLQQLHAKGCGALMLHVRHVALPALLLAGEQLTTTTKFGALTSTIQL